MFNFLFSIYLCVKENDGPYNCERFDDFNQAIVNFRRKNKSYYKISEINGTMIPICFFNPFVKQTLKYKLSKVFDDIYINDDDINIIF